MKLIDKYLYNRLLNKYIPASAGIYRDGDLSESMLFFETLTGRVLRYNGSSAKDQAFTMLDKQGNEVLVPIHSGELSMLVFIPKNGKLRYDFILGYTFARLAKYLPEHLTVWRQPLIESEMDVMYSIDGTKHTLVMKQGDEFVYTSDRGKQSIVDFKGRPLTVFSEQLYKKTKLHF